ncbi:MAG TPA: GtrA family protein [Candidatus Lustribacter sp.]|nr:GtrA family protein [Candidatus Lustribacter sp.]
MTQHAGLGGRLRDAFELIRRELVRFGLVGAMAFVVEIALFNLFLHVLIRDKVTTSKIVAASVATLCAWLGNRYWTFRQRSTGSLRRELVLFFAVNGLAIAVGAAWLAFTHYVLGLDSRLQDNISNVFGIGLGTLLRFWAYHELVFAEVSETQPLTGTTRT